MKTTLRKIASAAFVTALFGALPVTGMAHGGLSQGSAWLLQLHSLAHFLGDHPFIVMALGGVLLGAYTLYRSKNGNHRQSD
jgi:hypothetical protein